jgi:hypothetical protein
MKSVIGIAAGAVFALIGLLHSGIDRSPERVEVMPQSLSPPP